MATIENDENLKLIIKGNIFIREWKKLDQQYIGIANNEIIAAKSYCYHISKARAIIMDEIKELLAAPGVIERQYAIDTLADSIRSSDSFTKLIEELNKEVNNMFEKDKRKIETKDAEYNRFVDLPGMTITDAEEKPKPKIKREMFEEMYPHVEKGKDWRAPLNDDVPEHIKDYHKQLIEIEKYEIENNIIFD